MYVLEKDSLIRVQEPVAHHIVAYCESDFTKKTVIGAELGKGYAFSNGMAEVTKTHNSLGELINWFTNSHPEYTVINVISGAIIYSPKISKKEKKETRQTS